MDESPKAPVHTPPNCISILCKYEDDFSVIIKYVWMYLYPYQTVFLIHTYENTKALTQDTNTDFNTPSATHSHTIALSLKAASCLIQYPLLFYPHLTLTHTLTHSPSDTHPLTLTLTHTATPPLTLTLPISTPFLPSPHAQPNTHPPPTLTLTSHTQPLTLTHR